MSTLFRDDVGNVIAITAVKPDGKPVDLTGATVTIKFELPSGATTSVDGVIKDARAGVVEYVIAADLLAETGTWKLQAYLELRGGEKWHTPKASFLVAAPIEVA